MLHAIRQQKDAKLGNTRVEVIDFDGLDKRVNVYLHGKCICQLTDDELEVNHHGFMTVTTKSRINALMREFNGCTEIIQVQGRWFWQTLSKVVGVKHQWREIPSRSQPVYMPEQESLTMATTERSTAKQSFSFWIRSAQQKESSSKTIYVSSWIELMNFNLPRCKA